MLNKKWKEILYTLTPMGANFLMIMMMAYFTDAVDTRLLQSDASLWSFNGTTIVMPVLFGVLWTIGRIFDGFIDVPFASLTDRMKNKYMRVKMPIIIGTLPMIGAFIACCLPLQKSAESALNTWWFFVMAIIFFASYTLNLIAFYGSLSSICTDRKQRQRISSYKAIVDTILYSIAYALVPILLKAMGINILTFMLCCSPLMLTILIPLFLFRKRKNQDGTYQPIPDEEQDVQKVNIFKSIFFVFKNRAFWSWLLVNTISFFGLQMFLASQNALVSGVLNLGVMYSAILNTAAFAPVPLMIFLMYKLINKKGIRFTLQVSMIAFAVGIMGFFFASDFFWRDNVVPKVIIAGLGGTIASFSIGSFFAMPIMIPSQIAAVDTKITKRNNSAMYFAGQAVVTSIVGALATGVVYANIKGLEAVVDGNYVIKLGGMLVPCIVAFACLVAFGLTFLMPKDYNIKTIAKYFDKNYVVSQKDEAEDMGKPIDAEQQDTNEEQTLDTASPDNQDAPPDETNATVL